MQRKQTCSTCGEATKLQAESPQAGVCPSCGSLAVLAIMPVSVTAVERDMPDRGPTTASESVQVTVVDESGRELRYRFIDSKGDDRLRPALVRVGGQMVEDRQTLLHGFLQTPVVSEIEDATGQSLTVREVPCHA